ncbi:MAG: hypothetical protein HY898_30985 [Deltaproteobacteria bacterium]|nr:hypothetical protein [Deltaproteobacteria bacterium]
MPVDRHELEALKRDRLVERARAIGVERPEVLTRLELVDEILSVSIADDQERKRARGLLGRARDLVARVVEKGLNLPDAAQRLRTLAPPISAWRRGPPPIATISLAEIYAGQGHDKHALKVLDEVLEREPEHAYARKLKEKILASRDSNPAAAAPDPPAEPLEPDPPDPPAAPAPRARAPEPPARQRQNVAPLRPPEVIPPEDHIGLRANANAVRISWNLRPRSFAHARASRPDGRLVIRLLSVEPSWDGPRSRADDIPVDALRGRLDRPVPERTEWLCAAAGWLSSEGFVAFAATSIASAADQPASPAASRA